MAYYQKTEINNLIERIKDSKKNIVNKIKLQEQDIENKNDIGGNSIIEREIEQLKIYFKNYYEDKICGKEVYWMGIEFLLGIGSQEIVHDDKFQVAACIDILYTSLLIHEYLLFIPSLKQLKIPPINNKIFREDCWKEEQLRGLAVGYSDYMMLTGFRALKGQHVSSETQKRVMEWYNNYLYRTYYEAICIRKFLNKQQEFDDGYFKKLENNVWKKQRSLSAFGLGKKYVKDATDMWNKDEDISIKELEFMMMYKMVNQSAVLPGYTDVQKKNLDFISLRMSKVKGSVEEVAQAFRYVDNVL